GYPDLNPVFFPVFVDKDGKRIAFADSLKYPGVAGYTLMPQPFGFGHLYAPFRPPVPTTLRAFSTVPFDIHAGMQACDPTCHSNPNGDALALVSTARAQQFIVAARPRGGDRGPRAPASEDRHRPVPREELPEGHRAGPAGSPPTPPAPPRGRRPPGGRRAEWLFAGPGSRACHVPGGPLPAAGPL